MQVTYFLLYAFSTCSCPHLLSHKRLNSPLTFACLLASSFLHRSSLVFSTMGSSCTSHAHLSFLYTQEVCGASSSFLKLWLAKARWPRLAYLRNEPTMLLFLFLSHLFRNCPRKRARSLWVYIELFLFIVNTRRCYAKIDLIVRPDWNHSTQFSFIDQHFFIF